MAFNWTSNSN